MQLVCVFVVVFMLCALRHGVDQQPQTVGGYRKGFTGPHIVVAFDAPIPRGFYEVGCGSLELSSC